MAMEKNDNKTVIQECYELVTMPYRKKLSLSIYKANYIRYIKLNTEFNIELKKKTIKQLKMILYRLGVPIRNKEKKIFYINRIKNEFYILISLKRPVIYILGNKSRKDAERNLIENTTEFDLRQFYKKRSENEERRKQSAKNPKTLAEYYVYISNNGITHLTSKQNKEFKKLKAQEAAYNQLKSDKTR